MEKNIRIDILTSEGGYGMDVRWTSLDEETDYHNRAIEYALTALNKKHPEGYKITGVKLSESKL